MSFNRKYQLEDDSRKEYIETRIFRFIPTAFKEGYSVRIPAIVDMYAGSDIEVMSIIGDAVGKDHHTEKCFYLEKILELLTNNSDKRRAIALKECYKVLNVDNSKPIRVSDVPPPDYPKEKKTGKKDTTEDIDQILARYA